MEILGDRFSGVAPRSLCGPVSFSIYKTHRDKKHTEGVDWMKGFPWSKEDLELVKTMGGKIGIDELRNLLSVERTDRAIYHKLHKFGIYEKRVIKNYDKMKYKVIDGVKHKFCKHCERYLPSDDGYFPRDVNCADGTRNVCRECKGELFRVNSPCIPWSDEELALLKLHYPHYSNPEMVEMFFPDRTMGAVEGMGLSLKLRKTPETRDRINKFNGRRTSKLKKSKKHWVGKSNPMYDSQRYGEINPNYKGGITSLYSEMRRNINQWKTDSAIDCNYKCVLTNGAFDHIHHVYGFNFLVTKTLLEFGIEDETECIANYSVDDLKKMTSRCLELHYEHPLGVCMKDELHFLYHSEFAIATPFLFDKFVREYKSFKYDHLLSDRCKWINYCE